MKTNAEKLYKKRLIQRFNMLAQSRDYWKDLNRYYYDDLERYFSFLIPKNSSILELGCGTGDLLHNLRPKRGVGIDFSDKMLQIAKTRYADLEFRHADMETLEYWEETFDFVILSDTIGHLWDVEGFFRKMRKFCTADSRIIISYHNFFWEPVLKVGELFRQKMPEQYKNWLSSQDICNLLSLANYQVIKTDNRLLIPRRLPWLSNFVNKYLASLPGVRALTLCRHIVARPLKLKKHKDLSVSIVIPCRNEKGNIEAAIRRTPQFGTAQEFIFVDGHSTDGTQKEIEKVIRDHPKKNIQWVEQDGMGKGDAVRKGFSLAKADLLMILDADLTVPPEDLPKFYRAFVEDHGEFINGCRLVYPMEKEAMRFLNLLANKFFSLLFTWILNQPFKDTLCGTKVLSQRNYQKIAANRSYFGEFDPFGDFDLIFGAVKQNFKVVEIPIRYQERTYGRTKISRFRHGWLLLKMTFFAYKKFKTI